MRSNVREKKETHAGARASHISEIDELRRSALSCMLFESNFYEDGDDVTERIYKLCNSKKVECTQLLSLLEDVKDLGLRHVRLLIAVAACKRCGNHWNIDSHMAASIVEDSILRADELAEFCAIYARMNKQSPHDLTLSGAAKRGLARAFHKFDEYQLAKYDQRGPIRMRDVMRLVHPKPSNDEQSDMWKRLIAGELKTPDTWETRLSSGEDKREVFTDLLTRGNIGFLAILRNLRNMSDAGVDRSLIANGLLSKIDNRVWPYQIAQAMEHLPINEREIHSALQRVFIIASNRVCEGLTGETTVLVDVSGSMDWGISERSQATRLFAACSLAASLRRSNTHKVNYYSFSQVLEPVEYCDEVNEQIDAIKYSQPHYGTYMGTSIEALKASVPESKRHRLIVITDEQTSDRVRSSGFSNAYIVNVAPYQQGVGYGSYVHINGFSSAVIGYIREYEKLSESRGM